MEDEPGDYILMDNLIKRLEEDRSKLRTALASMCRAAEDMSLWDKTPGGAYYKSIAVLSEIASCEGSKGDG